MPDPPPAPRRRKLTTAQREEIRKALADGETGASIARRYGVTRQAIGLIKRAMDAERGDPGAIAAKTRRECNQAQMQLTDEEWEQLSQALQSSTPLDHTLAGKNDDDPEMWTVERAGKLADKLFDRTPATRRLRALLNTLFPGHSRRTDPVFNHRKPTPPVRVTKESIPLEFRKDPSYVTYVTSEVYWKIQQRTYEIELAEYERRQAGLPPRSDEEEFSPPPVRHPLPRKPKRKGPAFTQPKRRKKKKRK